MTKLILAVLFSFFCFGCAMLPELGMYFSWHLISPETELAKIALLILFWCVGAGLCVLSAMLAFIFWIAVTPEILR